MQRGCQLSELPGGSSSIETQQFSKVVHQASCLALSRRRLISSLCKLCQNLPLLALTAHFLVGIRCYGKEGPWLLLCQFACLDLFHFQRREGCIVRAIPGIHLSAFHPVFGRVCLVHVGKGFLQSKPRYLWARSTTTAHMKLRFPSYVTSSCPQDPMHLGSFSPISSLACFSPAGLPFIA